MPRGRKPKVALTLDQQIDVTKKEIVELEQKLKDKKALLKKLEERIDEEAKQKLVDAIEASGKTIEEVLEMLK